MRKCFLGSHVLLQMHYRDEVEPLQCSAISHAVCHFQWLTIRLSNRWPQISNSIILPSFDELFLISQLQDLTDEHYQDSSLLLNPGVVRTFCFQFVATARQRLKVSRKGVRITVTQCEQVHLILGDGPSAICFSWSIGDGLEDSSLDSLKPKSEHSCREIE